MPGRARGAMQSVHVSIFKRLLRLLFLIFDILAVTLDERQDVRTVRHVQPELEGRRLHDGRRTLLLVDGIM